MRRYSQLKAQTPCPDPTLSCGTQGLAGHEIGPGPATGLPPPGRPHPRPRPAVLARPTAGPRRRDHHRADLAHHPRTPPTAAHHHLHRPRRQLPPTHRTHQTPTRPVHRPEPRPTQEDHRDHHPDRRRGSQPSRCLRRVTTSRRQQPARTARRRSPRSDANATAHPPAAKPRGGPATNPTPPPPIAVSLCTTRRDTT